MQALPSVKIERYEQLKPGDLFSFRHHKTTSFALKCAKNRDGDPEEMVILGPHFPYPQPVAAIVPWEAVTVVSYGSDFTVMLPTNPDSWVENGGTEKAVCLAVGKDGNFICADGGKVPGMHALCFVDVATGRILDKGRPSMALYTYDWAIGVPGPGSKLTELVRFPLPLAK
jgi:hypothetical protein